MSEENSEIISKEDLDYIISAKTKATSAVSEAERVTASAKIADLEYRVVVQQIFIKYGLSINDRIDDNTGEITRVEETAQQNKDSE